MGWAELIKAIIETIGHGIERGNELYTSRINTANSSRGKNTFLRTLPLIIICVVLFALILIPKKTN